MVIASAISLPGLSPPLSSRRISLRLGSPSASNGSPAAGTWANCSAARLDAQLEPAGKLVERRPQVGHRPPEQSQKRAGVLLAHVKRGTAARGRRQLIGPDPTEEAEGHAAAEPQPRGRLKRRDLHREGPARGGLAADLHRPARRDTALNPVDAGIPGRPARASP